MKSIIETFYQIVKGVVFVLLAAFIIRGFIIQPFVVDGQSMEPNFHNQEYLIVEKLSYKIGQLKRGDVIIFQAPNNPSFDYIKRIIGLPGEKITIKNGKVYINEKELSENYLSSDEQTLIGNDPGMILERTLGPDEYFVFGDNRNHSSDSREFGILNKDLIVGKAWISVYPWDIFGIIQRPTYSY